MWSNYARRAWSALSRRRAAVGGAMAILGVAVTVVMANDLADSLDYHALIHALRGVHWLQILAAVVATGASFASLILRDGVALRCFGAEAPPAAVGLAGFCGTALSNTVGLGGLSAAAVRYRIYGAVGVPVETVSRTLAAISAGFALGLSVVLLATALVAAPLLSPLLGCPAGVLRAAAGLVLAAGVGLVAVFGARSRTLVVGGLALRSPGRRVVLAQIGLTVVDIAAAATALWALLPHGEVSYPVLLAVFACAIAVGGISHVPGGLGVFEAVTLYMLRGAMEPDRITAALVLFRMVYFVLPLVLSTAFLAGFELRRSGRPALQAPPLLGSAARLTPSFLAALTFLAGAVLVTSGATPSFQSRLAALSDVFPLWQIEAAHVFASVIGLLLLFTARGLHHRLDGAWWCATLLAPLAVALSLVSALAYTQAALLTILCVALLATREQFFQKASLIRQAFTPGWWFAIGAVLAAALWLLVFAFGYADFSSDSLWQVALDARASRALRSTVAACVLALAFGFGQLLRSVRLPHRRPARGDLERAARIIDAEGRSEALLSMMGDKSLLFSPSGQSFLMYATRGRSWIALYDPVGPAHERPELVRLFLTLVAGERGRAAFYHVRPDNLSLYIDAGLQVSKIGEEARVDLAAFSLAGARRSHLRYALKRGARDGLSFALLDPAAAGEAMPALEEISDAWLLARRTREKGFSVAAFNRDYLAGQLMAVVRLEGTPVAFASVMVAGGGRDATVGLMRHIPDASTYTMEFLFTNMILALKESGCHGLSLGTAPLSGVSPTPLGSRWTGVAHLLWRHGTRLYNFQGLRTFKGKFDPIWESRYLAVSGRLGPYMALADAAVLSSGGRLRGLPS